MEQSLGNGVQEPYSNATLPEAMVSRLLIDLITRFPPHSIPKRQLLLKLESDQAEEYNSLGNATKMKPKFSSGLPNTWSPEGRMAGHGALIV